MEYGKKQIADNIQMNPTVKKVVKIIFVAAAITAFLSIFTICSNIKNISDDGSLISLLTNVTYEAVSLGVIYLIQGSHQHYADFIR
jgi:hypothetical protein